MRQLPPLAAVRVFEAAARHGNFTRAAAELGMTQAAVSYQVRLLEERLGTPLFRRDKGRVTLTEAGQRAAPLVSGAFDTMDDAFAAARRQTEAVLTISAANTFAANWLAPRLGGFQLRHPELAVRLDASDQLVDFARDPADVGVRSTREVPPGLHGVRLFASEFTPMASPAFLARYPLLAPADLLGVPRLTPGDGWWQLWFDAAGVPAGNSNRAGLQLDSQVVEGAAALAAQGVALLNARMWTRELAEGRLVAPFPLVATAGSSFWLVCPESRRNQPRVRQFREWLLAEVAAAERLQTVAQQ
ncbi:transcriptional regulator GcvA [Sandarakinorhabdus sp. DWP1-3-1]|uniref:transcriptional regulator GcvA n=1 Tax=Sandarakinorhabdus sp. DWP1-3-1 TaxID=2804627 RepID=UPI003CE715C9